jgi:uncharacterized membrane protein
MNMKTSMKSSLVLILIGLAMIVIGIVLIWIVINDWNSVELVSKGILLLIGSILIIVGAIMIVKFIT